MSRVVFPAIVAALTAGAWMSIPTSANQDFMGVLKATPPLSPPFIRSPAFYDISSGPATVVFTTKVENLTDHVVTITVDINVHHITTYYGRNVADGEPGKPGIDFKPQDPPHTTQVVYGTPFQRTLTVQPKGAPPQMVSFSTVMTMCGYFQFDIGKHFKGGHENLSGGFARVLGCNSSSGGGSGGGSGGSGGGSGSSGGSGGVSAATAGVPLANTGEPVASFLLGLLLMCLGGVALRFRRA
jgi:hypothetical protein